MATEAFKFVGNGGVIANADLLVAFWIESVIVISSTKMLRDAILTN